MVGMTMRQNWKPRKQQSDLGPFFTLRVGVHHCLASTQTLSHIYCTLLSSFCLIAQLVSAAMQCADEDYLVAALKNVVAFAVEFPIPIVDKHKNSWSSKQVGRMVSLCCSAHIQQSLTYTESPSMKSSSLSHIRLRRIQSIRKVTLLS